jgi:hypothetical protein
MTGILCALPIIGAPTDSTSGTPAVSVSVSDTTPTGSASTATVSSNSTTASASGGTSPYTYAWTRKSGDRSISASSANSATTSFSRGSCIAGTSYSAVWRCEATDDNGNTAFSADVTITLTRTGSSGGGGGGGGGGGTFNGIANWSATAVDYGAPQTASYTIKSDGTIIDNSGTTGTWNSSSTVGSGYEVKATVTSGSPTSGTTGSWLSLSSNRSWTKAVTTVGSNASAAFTLQIRAAGTTTILDSATITLFAEAL